MKKLMWSGLCIFALILASGAQDMGCVACVYNKDIKVDSCVYASEPADECTNVYNNRGVLIGCFTSGYCESGGGGGGGDGCLDGYCDDGATHAPRCAKINLPVTPSVVKQHPWVTSPEIDAKLVSESSIPEMALILSQVRSYTKAKGVPTLWTISLSGVRASLRLGKDGAFRLRIYSTTSHLSTDELEKAHTKPTEIVKFEGHSYSHTVNDVELRGTF